MIPSSLDVFATSIMKFQFNQSEIEDLLDEIDQKKNKIKKTSSFYNTTINGSDEYYTDFLKPTKIHSFEMLMNTVGAYYVSNNLSFNVAHYWTALYGKNSVHEAHNHTSNNCNFASILYLTNNGKTTFYTPNFLSKQEFYEEQAEVGKFVIFPSQLFHSVFYKHSAERVIMSANLDIK